MKMSLLILFVINLLLVNGAQAKSEICGILTKDSPGASLAIQYFLTYGFSNEQHVVELKAGNQTVARLLSRSYNRSAVCVTGKFKAPTSFIVSKFEDQRIGM